MARDCIRPRRHVIQPLVIRRQPDLLDGPTVTIERPVKPTPNTWSRDLLRYIRATGPNADSSREETAMPDPIAEPAMSNVPDEPAWTDDELRTLIRFRRRVGRRWKNKLLDLYLFGKDDYEPEGSGLRRIRNRQGPSRVDRLKTSTLDAAEARLSAEPEQPS